MFFACHSADFSDTDDLYLMSDVNHRVQLNPECKFKGIDGSVVVTEGRHISCSSKLNTFRYSPCIST